jgi:pyruvate carboxylase
LEKRFGEKNINDKDLLSHALYPKVYEEWKEFAQAIMAMSVNFQLTIFEPND